MEEFLVRNFITCNEADVTLNDFEKASKNVLLKAVLSHEQM